MSFDLQDLNELDDFLKTATTVVPLIDVARGLAPEGSIAMRHDIDDDIHRSLSFAAWESERGYKSSYYVLHTAKYYLQTECWYVLDRIKGMGHEIGIHNNCVVKEGGLVDHANARMVYELAVLRHNGYDIKGAADHGDAEARSRHIVNEALWRTYPPARFGLEYEAYQQQRAHNGCISDNGGEWQSPFKLNEGVTHVLVHPQHWLAV